MTEKIDYIHYELHRLRGILIAILFFLIVISIIMLGIFILLIPQYKIWTTYIDILEMFITLS